MTEKLHPNAEGYACAICGRKRTKRQTRQWPDGLRRCRKHVVKCAICRQDLDPGMATIVDYNGSPRMVCPKHPLPTTA